MSGVEILEALDVGDTVKVEKIIKSNPHRSLLEVTEKEKWNWLHKSLMGFNPINPPKSVIEFLIRKGISINAQDIYGMTPLHYAMRARNAEAVIALLEAGADPNIPNQDRAIPLAMIRAMPERLDILELMLKKGADIHFHNGEYEVLEGIKKNRGDEAIFKPVIEMMENFSQKKAGPNERSKK